jgi:hypothetical protein
VTIVMLAAGTALIAITLVIVLHARVGRWFNSRRLPVDDAYTAWFAANSRSGEALREWLEAAPAARPDAYRAYLAELELEEAAAAELELRAMAPAA